LRKKYQNWKRKEGKYEGKMKRKYTGKSEVKMVKLIQTGQKKQKAFVRNKYWRKDGGRGRVGIYFIPCSSKHRNS
jgi:hypothetical protein